MIVPFRAGAVALSLLMVASAPAWAQAPTLAPAPAAAVQADDPVVAVVNGSEIRRSAVLKAIDGLPAQYKQMPREMLFNTVQRQVVDRQLIAQAAEAAKVEDTASFKKRLADTRERLMQEVWLTEVVDAKLTDAFVKQRYDEAMKAAGPREEVRARHILCRDEADAKKAVAELEKGADFAEVAKKYSIDGSAGDGGDLGYFTRDMMVKEFSDAAFALKKGDYTHTPVKSQFGWHVIKVEDKREQSPPSFADFKDEIRQEMAQEIIVAKLDDLRKTAKIEEFDENGKPRK
jgi:peptidyl-prolyl cis-trans isomerase C